MAITLAGNSAIDISLLPPQKQAQAKAMNLVDPQLQIHNGSHGAFEQGCAVCTFTATWAIETKSINDAVKANASAFLAKIPVETMLNDLALIRTALGGDGPAWINKAEYFR